MLENVQIYSNGNVVQNLTLGSSESSSKIINFTMSSLSDGTYTIYVNGITTEFQILSTTPSIPFSYWNLAYSATFTVSFSQALGSYVSLSSAFVKDSVSQVSASLAILNPGGNDALLSFRALAEVTNWVLNMNLSNMTSTMKVSFATNNLINSFSPTSLALRGSQNLNFSLNFKHLIS